MSKLIKILLIILTTITLMLCYSSKAYAFGEIKNQGDSFISMGESNVVITEDHAITGLITIGRILVQIATIVLVIVGFVLGIKYMISGADEKANVKQRLIWYVISVALVYGAVGIYQIIRNVMGNLF